MIRVCPYLNDGQDCGYFDAPSPENVLCLCNQDLEDLDPEVSQ